MIKLFGAKFKCSERLGLCLGSFGCPYMFVFQIDWLRIRRKEICVSGMWSGFHYGSSL